MAVGEDRVELRAACDCAAEDRQRQAGDADGARLALGLQAMQCRDALVEDAVEVAELDVVQEQHVETFDLQALQALFAAPFDALR